MGGENIDSKSYNTLQRKNSSGGELSKILDGEKGKNMELENLIIKKNKEMDNIE